MLVRWVKHEDGDTEKYHHSRVIQDFVFLSRKRGCIRCISLQVYTKFSYQTTIFVLISIPYRYYVSIFYNHEPKINNEIAPNQKLI